MSAPSKFAAETLARRLRNGVFVVNDLNSRVFSGRICVVSLRYAIAKVCLFKASCL